MRAKRFAVAAVAAILTITPALADDIPPELHGMWGANGACDSQMTTIMFDATTLRYQDADGPADALYSPDDSPRGNGAIHFAEEGNVSNWDYDAGSDVLLYNEQGYGMGVPPVVYSRCASGDDATGDTPVFNDDPMPDTLFGDWGFEGDCEDPDNVISVAQGSVKWGTNPPDATYYVANDSPRGNGAIHWAEEGVVSNLEYDIATDRVLYNEAGYGMGDQPAVFNACPPM